MDVQFVADNKGKIKAVQVALKDWKALTKKAEAFDIANSIRQGLKEVELIESGQLKAKTLDELLNEL